VVQDAVRKVDDVETRQKKLEQAIEQEREKIRKETAEELRERELRRKNVVMHRVGEAGPEVKSVDERRNWDMRSCSNIFNALQLNMNSEDAVKFVRRVGERGEGPRPLVVGLRREWQREELLDSAKQLKNTQFSDVVIVPDLTKEQRKAEAAMFSEAEQRNKDLTEDDRAKNVEWMVVGARGEKRLVKGAARPRGAAANGSQRGAATGGPPRGAAASGPPRWQPTARGRGSPSLLPPRLRQGPWDPATRGRGAGTRGRPRANSKRTRADRQEQDEEEEEQMEDDRQAPPQPMPRN
jgi:hypothetical protein